MLRSLTVFLPILFLIFGCNNRPTKVARVDAGNVPVPQQVLKGAGRHRIVIKTPGGIYERSPQIEAICERAEEVIEEGSADMVCLAPRVTTVTWRQEACGDMYSCVVQHGSGPVPVARLAFGTDEAEQLAALPCFPHDAFPAQGLTLAPGRQSMCVMTSWLDEESGESHYSAECKLFGMLH